MEYRLNKKTLLEKLGEWNSFLRRKISLIACGGTALTLLDVKASMEARHDEIDINYLTAHFKKLASYDVSEDRLFKNLDSFLLLLKEKNLYG
jgi:hypothetical protein